LNKIISKIRPEEVNMPIAGQKIKINGSMFEITIWKKSPLEKQIFFPYALETKSGIGNIKVLVEKRK